MGTFLKFMIIWSAVGIFIIAIFALIGYVLYTVNIFIGIVFMIVLALITGYFGVRIKMAFDKKKREKDIDKKIEKQKFFMKTKDPKKKTVGLPPKIPKEEIIKQPVKERVPKPINLELKKIKALEKTIKDAKKSVRVAKKKSKKKVKK